MGGAARSSNVCATTGLTGTGQSSGPPFPPVPPFPPLFPLPPASPPAPPMAAVAAVAALSASPTVSAAISATTGVSASAADGRRCRRCRHAGSAGSNSSNSSISRVRTRVRSSPELSDATKRGIGGVEQLEQLDQPGAHPGALFSRVVRRHQTRVEGQRLRGAETGSAHEWLSGHQASPGPAVG